MQKSRDLLNELWGGDFREEELALENLTIDLDAMESFYEKLQQEPESLRKELGEIDTLFDMGSETTQDFQDLQDHLG